MYYSLTKGWGRFEYDWMRIPKWCFLSFQAIPFKFAWILFLLFWNRRFCNSTALLHQPPSVFIEYFDFISKQKLHSPSHDRNVKHVTSHKLSDLILHLSFRVFLSFFMLSLQLVLKGKHLTEGEEATFHKFNYAERTIISAQNSRFFRRLTWNTKWRKEAKDLFRGCTTKRSGLWGGGCRKCRNSPKIHNRRGCSSHTSTVH